jgi:hypothetical protein
MKEYGGVDVQIYVSLTSALARGERSSPLYPLELISRRHSDLFIVNYILDTEFDNVRACQRTETLIAAHSLRCERPKWKRRDGAQVTAIWDAGVARDTDITASR